MRLVTGRRIVSAPKAVFALVFFGSAIACDGSSHGLPTPMAQDDAGLARSWMTCPDPIEIVLDARLGRAPHVLELTQKAAAAWQTPGVARLMVRSGATSGVNEDGVNVLTFAPPSWLCPKEKARGCDLVDLFRTGALRSCSAIGSMSPCVVTEFSLGRSVAVRR